MSWDRRRSTGRLFQARGPATARARSPMVERRVAGTRNSAVDKTIKQTRMQKQVQFMLLLEFMTYAVSFDTKNSIQNDIRYWYHLEFRHVLRDVYSDATQLNSTSS